MPGVMPGYELTGDAVTIAHRWTYVWGASRRPFVHPLRTPAGLVLTRDAPDDHPWHHGLWFTIKFVNGENFWEEYDAYGVLRHDGAPDVEEARGRVQVQGTLRWVRPDRETVVIDETRSLTHREVQAGAYAIDFETAITPRVDAVLDRTPFTTWGGYGGLTLRGSAQWAGTELLLSDGTTDQQVHGRPARWCDLSNDDGGLAILDHPANPRFPTPWYGSTKADTYGEGWANFVNAAFLWDEPLAVGAGEPLRFRYRVLVHDGRLEHAAIDAAHEAFVR